MCWNLWFPPSGWSLCWYTAWVTNYETLSPVSSSPSTTTHIQWLSALPRLVRNTCLNCSSRAFSTCALYWILKKCIMARFGGLVYSANCNLIAWLLLMMPWHLHWFHFCPKRDKRQWLCVRALIWRTWQCGADKKCLPDRCLTKWLIQWQINHKHDPKQWLKPAHESHAEA